MNSYERVLTAVGHKQPDRPPLQFSATEEVTDSLRTYLKAGDREELLVKLGVDFRGPGAEVRKTQPIPPHVRDRYGEGPGTETTCYGAVLVKAKDFPQSHRVYGPFYENEDLDSFDWPSASDVQSAEELRPEIARYNQQGYCTVVGSHNPFKIGYFMRPYEEFMMDCVAQPDYAIELMRRVAEVEFTNATTGVAAGARAAVINGDFAHQHALMISPSTFRKVLKPLLVEFVSRVKGVNPEALAFLHSDGNLFPVLGDLIECGFDAVHPIQPESMDMFEVKRRYGDRLTLFGGMSVQSDLPGSKPEEIRSLVRERIRVLGEGGGFFMCPTNSILNDVPVESIVAMYEEAQVT